MPELKLAIDPGHGWSNRSKNRHDPGAIGGDLVEADVALAWALTLNWVCKEAGIETFLTRDSDIAHAPLGTRDDRARAQGCTHLISLHCNAGGGTGCETFYRDDSDLPLARMVQSAIVATTGGINRGVKHETQTHVKRLAILDFAGPACLVELGFIDRPMDRAWLRSRDARLAFAKAVVAGLKGAAKK